MAVFQIDTYGAHLVNSAAEAEEALSTIRNSIPGGDFGSLVCIAPSANLLYTIQNNYGEYAYYTAPTFYSTVAGSSTVSLNGEILSAENVLQTYFN